MNEWRETTLADICTDIQYGYTASANAIPVGPRFLRITDIQNNYVDWNTVPYCEISDSDYRKYKLQPGDICIARTGASTGTSTIIKYDVDAVFASYLIRYQIDQTKANSSFVSYQLMSDWYWQHVHSVMGGSAQPNANAKQLGSFQFNLPPLPIQRRIAEILGRLDDKIEANRRINRTLEAMAQALYKHWFVDFGPFQDGAFVESELGLIPKGWGVGRVADFGDIVTGKTPPTKEDAYFGDDVPFIKIPDMHGQVFVSQTSSRLSKLGAESQSKKYIPARSICVSCIATAGLVCLTSESSQTNQQINSIVPLNDSWAEFIYCQMSELGEHIRLLGSSGSATLNLNKNDFSNIRVLLPPNDVVVQFHSQVSSWFSQILNCYEESRQLAAIRDYLLPRLLSGGLSVEA